MHRNAALTPTHRLRLARLVVEQGWPVARAAERYDVSWPTAKRWADRYRQLGAAGMTDRSSRPHRCPARTAPPLVRKIVHLRWKQRLGPVGIAAQLSLAPSTVHAVLRRCQLNRLSHVDRRTGEPVLRYEHPHPGALLHVDVKKPRAEPRHESPWTRPPRKRCNCAVFLILLAMDRRQRVLASATVQFRRRWTVGRGGAAVARPAGRTHWARSGPRRRRRPEVRRSLASRVTAGRPSGRAVRRAGRVGAPL